jgi:hypothetical protein
MGAERKPERRRSYSILEEFQRLKEQKEKIEEENPELYWVNPEEFS